MKINKMFKKLRAFVLFTSRGNLIPGSLILSYDPVTRRGYREIPYSMPDVPYEYPNKLYCQDIWMTKNLDVSTYSNGDPIQYISDPAAWAATTEGAFCFYDFNPSNSSTYGMLYNHYALTDPRGLAPMEWRIPSFDDWKKLIRSCLIQQIYQTGYETFQNISTNVNYPWAQYLWHGIADKMRSQPSLWVLPNTPATNDSGFSVLPGGSASNFGIFSGINESANFWCLDSIPDANVPPITNIELVQSITFVSGNENLIIQNVESSTINPVPGSAGNGKNTGFSVRCVK